MTVSFSITLGGETFSIAVPIDQSNKQVVGKLRQDCISESGQRRAVFIFRRGLGRSDSSLSMHIKLLDASGNTEAVWHAVVSLSGTVIHLHAQ